MQTAPARVSFAFHSAKSHVPFHIDNLLIGIELDFHVRHLFLYRGFIIPHGKAFFCDEVTLRKFLHKPKRAVKQYVRYRFTALYL